MSEDVQAALREMARTIGGLESTVKGMVQTWQSQEASASQGRRDLHQKVDALRDEFHAHQTDLHDMGTQIAGALKDIAEMRPTVDQVRSAREQVTGAVVAGRWLSRGVYWIAFALTLGVGWVLSNWINIKVGLR
jgi:uncharacterized protein YoxC